MVGGKTLAQWLDERPELADVTAARETLWLNPHYCDFATAQTRTEQVRDAALRLERFAPYIAKAFPETRKPSDFNASESFNAGQTPDTMDGIIESPLREVPEFIQKASAHFGTSIQGRVFLKCDNDLPISGSIKARGGIYEVLKHAETLAIRAGMLSVNDDYSVLDSSPFRKLFSRHSIAVGSTGNLGLSIGLMGSTLGFRVDVHMSSDAKQWKKDLLRSRGVHVIEYASDYNTAVASGRKQADANPEMHFVDDENSIDLFMGYAVAAARLERQLLNAGIRPGKDCPLFVYLPCGVGGGPGGVCFGLKQIFRDNVHCFFAEPTNSPCMLLGLLTGLHGKVSVRDFGLSNVTEADGLAVAKPSSFVGRTLKSMISGVLTVQDDTLLKLLYLMADTQDIKLEPSALAAMPGPFRMQAVGNKYNTRHNIDLKQAVHILWATGGSMVPADEMARYIELGKQLLRDLYIKTGSPGRGTA